MNDCVICLGVRGSLPVSRADSVRFGGSTTCFFVRLDGTPLILDAGSGLAALPACLTPDDTKASLFITHAHADHLIGLPYLLLPCKNGLSLDIYGKTRLGLSVREQIDRLVSPPLWPVGMDVIARGARYHELTERMNVGNVTVESLEGEHPGGVSVLKLTGGGKRVVLMTDCTVNDANREALTAFAKDCDVLLIDGQYSDEEWQGHETFGHNTYSMAAAFGETCGAKQVRIIHHAPYRNDAALDEAEKNTGCRFAIEGEVIAL